MAKTAKRDPLDALTQEQCVARLKKIRKIAAAQLAEESVDDVKYVMRELDDILVLAGGKRTNGW